MKDRNPEEVSQIVLLGTAGFDAMPEDDRDYVQKMIADLVDQADWEKITVHADDGVVGRSVEMLMDSHDERVHLHRYCSDGRVEFSYSTREEVLGVESDARRIFVLDPWISGDSRGRVGLRGMDDIAQARDIAMIAAAARAGASACVSIDARWHKNLGGTNARTIAKRMGMNVSRFIFDRVNDKLIFERVAG